ncbi:MAG: hypothetical protein IJT49_04710 [Clostridia bacterium]|nr:hypothetical protein [Clostridia bacterium]
MKEIVIRKTNFQIVGYVQVESNGDKTVTDYYRRVLGSYDAASDTVRDFQGRVIARGDAAVILLKDQF